MNFPIKILHTADLHLGRQFNGISLEEDHQAIFSQVVVAIIKYHPDVFIIAGDIYGRTSPPNNSIKQFNTFLTRVARETIVAVVMIAGNHDSGDRIGSMSIMTDTKRALIQGPLAADASSLVLKDAHGAVVFLTLPFAYGYAARKCFGVESIATPEDVLSTQITAATWSTSMSKMRKWQRPHLICWKPAMWPQTWCFASKPECAKLPNLPLSCGS